MKARKISTYLYEIYDASRPKKVVATVEFFPESVLVDFGRKGWDRVERKFTYSLKAKGDEKLALELYEKSAKMTPGHKEN